MKAGQLPPEEIHDLAKYFAKELTLRNKQFDPDNPKAFVEFFFSSYDALLKELDSQNESREKQQGVLFHVLDVD